VLVIGPSGALGALLGIIGALPGRLGATVGWSGITLTLGRLVYASDGTVWLEGLGLKAIVVAFMHESAERPTRGLAGELLPRLGCAMVGVEAGWVRASPSIVYFVTFAGP
jgi:hypothetical protein